MERQHATLCIDSPDNGDGVMNMYRKLHTKNPIWPVMVILVSPLTVSCQDTADTTEDERPNIIVVMADDLGYSDLSSYGGEIDTPNIDALAENGVRFTQFYNAGRCAPSRASLLTGLYAHKAGLGYMTAQDYGSPGYRGDLNKDSITIAEVLGEAGYATYMAGKWHVNLNFGPDGSKHNWPLQRGFDQFFGTLIAAGSYWDPLTLIEGNSYVEPDEDFYYTEAITDKAISYIENNGVGFPFFLYLAYTAPHWPLHAREEAIAKHRGKFADGWDQLREERHSRLIEKGILESIWELPARDERNIPWTDVEDKQWEQTRMEAYAGTIEQLDQGIGKLVSALEEQGMLENTIIFFLSDNGGDNTEHLNGMIGESGKPWSVMKYVPLYTRKGDVVISGDYPGVVLGPENTYGSYGLRWANLSNAPFRKFKTYVHEGGIASPLIVHWPNGKIGRNELRKQPAHIIDIMPTILELAATDHPTTHRDRTTIPLDGHSLLPILVDDEKAEDTYYWEHQGNKAVRAGDWKLVSALGNGTWELYDMAVDRTENYNLASRYPEKVNELEAIYDQWAAESNVIPWDEMDIHIIAGKESPLARPRDEADEAYKEVQEHLKKMMHQ